MRTDMKRTYVGVFLFLIGFCMVVAWTVLLGQQPTKVDIGRQGKGVTGDTITMLQESEINQTLRTQGGADNYCYVDLTTACKISSSALQQLVRGTMLKVMFGPDQAMNMPTRMEIFNGIGGGSKPIWYRGVPVQAGELKPFGIRVVVWNDLIVAGGVWELQ